MSDTLTMLGKLAPPEARRDAVHVAVVPVVASVPLYPGDFVGIREGQATQVAPYVGVVDPFLTQGVQKGERFWLFLKPGTITSLRHVWTHPAFEEEGKGPAVEAATIQKAVSRAWLLSWCREKWPYDEPEAMLQYLLSGLPDGELCFGRENYPHDWDQFPPEFWTHYKVLTDKERPTVEANFRCAC